MNIVVRCWIVVLICLLPITTLAADISSEKTIPPAYQIVSTELPPFTSADPAAPGALSELTLAMMHEAGMKGDIQYLPWARSIYLATTQARTLILPLTRTPERERQYHWVQRLYIQHFVLLTRNDAGIDLSDINSLKSKEVVVLRASPNALQLKQLGFQNITEMATVEQMAKMLAAKRVDLMFGGGAICGYFLAREGLTAARIKISAPLESGEVWLAGSLDIPASESAIWQDALQRIKANGNYEKIMRRYGLTPEK
jgi:polar amino acid transport system substrate-binding protein